METTNIFIAHPTTSEQADALKAFFKALKIKFEVTEKPYDPDFVAKIEKGRQDFAEGKGTIMSIDQLNDLWK
jgi:hypothetical protein